MTPEPAAYLTEALDYIQRHALRSRDVDWNTVRTEALVRIQDAHTTADTYPTLRWVLSCLGDHHSHLLSPEGVKRNQERIVTALGLVAVYPEAVIAMIDPHSPADQVGLQVRDTIVTINGELVTNLDRTSFKRALSASPLSLTIRRANEAGTSSVTLHAASYTQETRPQGWPFGPHIGYLELPAVSGNNALVKTYAHAAQQCIRDIDQAGTYQWVIDLRRNMGGNMWPMLAGVQALLGNDECGFFVPPDGKRASWLASKAASIMELLGEPYHLTHPSGATAVLTSRLTASSGEFTALAFRGRPQTRSFGEPTAGLPTANSPKMLSDGARLVLTVSLGADRTGQTYDGPLVPDEVVTSDWTLFQTERDPVVLAAVTWLGRQGSETGAEER